MSVPKRFKTKRQKNFMPVTREVLLKTNLFPQIFKDTQFIHNTKKKKIKSFHVDYCIKK